METDFVLHERARVTTLAFWGVAAANVAAMFAGVYLGNELRSIDETAFVAERGLVGGDIAYGVAGLAKIVALLTAAVLFLRWFYRLHQNLSRFDGPQPEYDSKWTVWGFLVPVLNVSRPHRLMREAWSITSDQWDQQAVGAESRRPKDWVNLWWVMFLVASTLGNLVSLAALRATTVHDQLTAIWTTVFADAIGVIAVLVAISLVRNMTELQYRVLANLSAREDS